MGLIFPNQDVDTVWQRKRCEVLTGIEHLATVKLLVVSVKENSAGGLKLCFMASAI
jgi:hypothetical protein